MRAWRDFRSELVKQMMGDETDGESRDIYLKIKEYEDYPLTIEDLQEVLNLRGSGWKYKTVFRACVDLPIPKFEGENLSNVWFFMVRFAYNKTKRHFKMLLTRDVRSKAGFRNVYYSGSHSMTIHCKECDLNRSFLYALRDKFGVHLARLKRMQLCGRVYKPWYSERNYMCASHVQHKGAMCEDCRNIHLKRKIEQI